MSCRCPTARSAERATRPPDRLSNVRQVTLDDFLSVLSASRQFNRARHGISSCRAVLRCLCADIMAARAPRNAPGVFPWTLQSCRRSASAVFITRWICRASVRSRAIRDLRGRFDEYIGGIDLRGQTVLDVGTASGFLSFEAERRGATVFSFDADGPERIQVVPPAMPDVRYFHGMRNSYLLAHNAFQSKATPI